MPISTFRMNLWHKLKQNKSSPAVCLGVDPGLGRVGFAFILKEGHSFTAVEYGCIETPPRTDVSQRLEMIYDKLGERIRCCSPDFMSVESLFFGRNTTTAGNVWQARGIVLLLASQYQLPLYEPKPAQIKMAVCGSGSADKKQVQRMVQRLLNLKEKPKPDDTADALAIAITGFALHPYAQRTGVGDRLC